MDGRNHEATAAAIPPKVTFSPEAGRGSAAAPFDPTLTMRSPSPSLRGELHRSNSSFSEHDAEELNSLRQHARVVDSVIHADDLSSTPVDQAAGFTDWRDCPVSGSHLRAGGHSSKGAQGEVMRAIWKKTIPVAIKENINDDSTFTKELTKEMQLFLDLHHPHVVPCYGILKEARGEVDEQTGEMQVTKSVGGSVQVKNSIVTEHCRTSLDHYLKTHANWDGLPPALIDRRKYTILLHACLGLQKLHDMGVLHRDIKAGNLLLDGAPGICPTCDRQGTWKICDFGEAKVLKAPNLTFAAPEPVPAGVTASLVKSNRFQKITSPSLRESTGARYYCWLVPGEKVATADGGEWARVTPGGGFMYSFSDDPSMHDSRDCVFNVGGDQSAANLQVQ